MAPRWAATRGRRQRSTRRETRNALATLATDFQIKANDKDCDRGVQPFERGASRDSLFQKDEPVKYQEGTDRNQAATSARRLFTVSDLRLLISGFWPVCQRSQKRYAAKNGRTSRNRIAR